MTTKTQASEQNQLAANSFSEKDVLNWLLEHPEFMVRHADKLASEHQQEAENITPLHAVRAARAEKSNQTLEKKHQRIIRTAEANAHSTADVFNVVPELIRCNSLPKLRKYIQTNLKKDLQVDATRLILAGETETATTLPVETIHNYFSNKSIQLRTLYDAADRKLYGATGKMMKSDALFLLSSQSGQTLGMLALASQNDSRFHPGQGQELAIFFGNTVSAVLEQALA
ncbi:MAG: DUF484 family protein [Alphaproteobacteria bacterium]|nr:DUF484 family protein [Alphaproteobacteria bacterium]MDD9919413.1 DUF484 family protein [Alphaproteobacteria bacterium]